MSISSRAIGERPVADGQADAAGGKTPPKRQMTALADPKLQPEQR